MFRKPFHKQPCICNLSYSFHIRGLNCRKLDVVYLLVGRRTCQTKCNVAIHNPDDHMYLDTFYSLRRTTVYFGEKPASENKCARLVNQIDSQMIVYCSSRQDGKI